MKRIHIVGRKNHGKTTLIVELTEELTRRGCRVGTIKHTYHAHELDIPGKDSYRQRAAGASPVAVVTRDLVGAYLPRIDEGDPYRRLEAVFSGCQIVLVEGDGSGDGLKVEVWRAAEGGACLAAERSDITAVISDDGPRVNVPLWPRDDIVGLADRIWSMAGHRDSIAS